MYDSDLNCNLTKEISEKIKYASSYNQLRIANAKLDTRMRAGDTSVYGVLFPHLPAEMRNVLPINRIKPDCEAIAGIQRTNRKQPYFEHRNPEYQYTAELLTKLVHASMQYGDENTQETFSNAFDASITAGCGLLQVWVDWDRDPICGDLRTSYVPIDQYIIDPDWQGSPTLTDMSYLHVYKFVDCRTASFLFPKYKNAITRKPNPNILIKHRVQNSHVVTLEEHWYVDYVEQTNIIDINTGIYFKFFGEESEKNRLLRLARGTMREYTSTVRSARRALAINGCFVEDDWSPLNTDDMPFVMPTSYFYPDLDISHSCRLQGVVRGMAAMQYYYNQHMTLNLWSVQKQVFPRFAFFEDAIVNTDDLDDPTSTRNVKLNSKSVSSTEIRLLENNNIIANNSALLDQIKSDMNYYSSINQEVTGTASADIAASLASARQGAGINAQQTLFDHADQAMCQLGKIFANYHKSNTLPYKVQQLTGMEPTQSFYIGVFPEYNVAVRQGLLTQSQREKEAAILLQLMDKGFTGISPDEIIDRIGITNSSEIKQQIKQSQETAQMAQQEQEQQQLQLSLPKEEAQANYLNAAAESARASAAERISRVAENQGLAEKNHASAIAEQEKALLDHVKAVAEIEEIDLNNRSRYLDIADRIRESLQQ